MRVSLVALSCRTLSSRPIRVAVYPGDGIGVDVTKQALRVIEHVESAIGGFKIEPTWMPWNSGDYFDTHGKAAPDDMINTLRGFDAIFLGAVGWPEKRPDHETLEPLIRMRQSFDQFACVRPARTFDGVPMPLAAQNTIDMVVVRENSEGEYVNAGGRFAQGKPNEVAMQTAVHTRAGVERALRYGFALARSPGRRHKLTLITKSNAQRFGMTLWDDVLDDLVAGGEYPDVATDKQHIDAACMNFVRRPQDFDVIVASNLFGDILTDLRCGAASACMAPPPSMQSGS